jgi:hypothetical protein
MALGLGLVCSQDSPQQLTFENNIVICFSSGADPAPVTRVPHVLPSAIQGRYMASLLIFEYVKTRVAKPINYHVPLPHGTLES